MPTGSSHPLGDRFRKFGNDECKDSSPLYSVLSLGIAEDSALLEVAAEAREGQPVPNLFFAAVHYLLQGGSEHALREFYPTCTEEPADRAGAFVAFSDFVLSHRDEIVALLKTRLVQTNEVRRSAYLFPALAFAASHFEPRPLALIEIGTSAGLNLAWDRYAYSYGDGNLYGDATCPFVITSEFRCAFPGPPAFRVPAIVTRMGFDLNPIDLCDLDRISWLRALIWPEHLDRMGLLDAAIGRAKELDLDLRQGDGFDLVEQVAAEISVDWLLCVYHTHVANQVPEEKKTAFLAALERIGSRRDLIHVCNNIRPHLHLTAYRSGERIDLPLARDEGHGRWIEWLAQGAEPG